MKNKRKKTTRIRGRRTVGYGSRKKHRGKGSRGGKGMAGTGKRADQRKTFILKYLPGYFGKRGFKGKKIKIKIINLQDIEKKLEKFLKEGIAKKATEGIEIDLHDYKILSKGNIKEKIIIKAKAFSKKAKEKIEKVGGKCLS